jgi:tetratricopeptide (TPR) repeat protein
MNNLSAVVMKKYFFIILFIFLNIFIVEITPCQALTESDMKNPTILTNEGWKYLSKEWNNKTKGNNNNLDKAYEYFQKALKLDLHHADAYAGLGRIAMERGRLYNVPSPYNEYSKDACEKALPLYNMAIAYEEDNFRAHYDKCLALLCLEEFDAAISEIEIFQKKDVCWSHWVKARAYKGKYLRGKDPSDKKMAILEATDYLECKEGGLNLFRDVMRTMKDFDSTEKYLKHNIEVKPDTMSSYYNYYNLILIRTDEGYLKDSDPAEAERIIREGKAKTNFDIGAMWEVYLHRAPKLVERKEYDRALFEYTEALAGNSNLGHLSKEINSLCSQFSDDRCIKSWQRIIQAHIDSGKCVKANEEFNTQHEKYPAAFEKMKISVSECIEKKS